MLRVESSKPKKRTTVGYHKKQLSLSSIPPSDRQKIKLLIHKLMKDYKSVSEKRGSKNFNTERWINNNI